MDFITANATSMITSVESLPQANIATPSGYYVTPIRIAKAYDIPDATGAGVKVGIISLGGGWLQSDLDKAMGNLGISKYPSSITSVTVDGATTPWTGTGADLENTLDIYCVASLVPQANIVMYTGLNSGISFSTNPSSAATYNRTISFVNTINKAIDDGCDVISISWGSTEKIISGNLALYCGDYMDVVMAKAVARGVTVLIASGDYGSAPLSGYTYPAVQYPASNGNVVAVGGTLLLTDAIGNRTSEAVHSSSGGGVSDILPLPAFQSNLNYKTFNSTTNTTSANIALTTRGIPDIAAPYTTYPMWYNGNVVGVSGTSASAPVLAGMMARFVQLTGRRLGLINNVLYSNAIPGTTFYDITTGIDTVASAQGYVAQAGWDPIVGLGSPYGRAILQVLKTLYGSTFPKTLSGIRPATGATYPRRVNGIR